MEVPSGIKFGIDSWLKHFKIIADSDLDRNTSSSLIPSTRVSGSEIRSSTNFQCNLCFKIIKVQNSTAHNLKSHIRKIHSSVAAEIIYDVASNEKSKKRKAPMPCLNGKRMRQNPTQDDLESMIVGTICENSLSFNVLSTPSMRHLLQSGFPQLKIPSRKSLIPKLHDQYDEMVDYMKNKLRKIDFVCLTADSWSSYHRCVLCHIQFRGRLVIHFYKF